MLNLSIFILKAENADFHFESLRSILDLPKLKIEFDPRAGSITWGAEDTSEKEKMFIRPIFSHDYSKVYWSKIHTQDMYLTIRYLCISYV